MENEWTVELFRLREDKTTLLEALKILSSWPLRSVCSSGLTAYNDMGSLANARRFARETVEAVERKEP